MLNGKRVTLRALAEADLPQLWAMNNDLEVELAGGGDPPQPQSLARLQAEFAQEAGRGGRDDHRFAIAVEGKFIGHCALFHYDPVARTCELGISIGDKAYWGRGFGREAVQLLLDYAFRLHNQRRVYLRVNSNNARAIRAYAACGFIEEGRLRQHVWNDGAYRDLVFMGLLREEWVPEK